jgi:hypothetical protein
VCLVVAISLIPGLTRSTWAQAAGAAIPGGEPAPRSPILTRPVAQDIVALPTTASLDRHSSYFRLTHRFAYDLGGPFKETLKRAFGLDEGAIIGFEYRFAPASNFQLGVHRSLLYKTIQIFARHDTIRQSTRMPVAISLLGSVEGTNNLRAQYSQAAGLVVSRTFRDRLAVYVSPVFVWNSQIPTGVTGHEAHDHEIPGVDPDDHPLEREQTLHAGLGARLRLRPTVFVVGEFVPRAGFTPGAHQWAAGIEKRTDGHQFQLNFSNSFNTTNAQIARGGQAGNVYLGFNLARRF